MPVDVQDLDCDFYVSLDTKCMRRRAAESSELSCLKDEPFQGGGDMIKTVTFRKRPMPIADKMEAGTRQSRLRWPGCSNDYLSSIGRDRAAVYESELLRCDRACLGNRGRTNNWHGETQSECAFVVIDGIHHDIGQFSIRKELPFEPAIIAPNR
jgi:selenocysteine lyase/cysteine desulfurase